MLNDAEGAFIAHRQIYIHLYISEANRKSIKISLNEAVSFEIEPKRAGIGSRGRVNLRAKQATIQSRLCGGALIAAY